MTERVKSFRRLYFHILTCNKAYRGVVRTNPRPVSLRWELASAPELPTGTSAMERGTPDAPAEPCWKDNREKQP